VACAPRERIAIYAAIEGTPHVHSACYEGALSGIGGARANPRMQTTPGGGRSFPGSTGTFDATRTAPQAGPVGGR
jgi:hypothetical protein